MGNSKSDRGVAYIRARMQSDGRVESVLRDIRREIIRGDVTAERVHRDTLDQLIYARHDNAPMYTPADVTVVAEALR